MAEGGRRERRRPSPGAGVRSVASESSAMADARGEPPAKRPCLGSCGAAATTGAAAAAKAAQTKPGHGRFHKPDALLDISAKKVAEKWPFEQMCGGKCADLLHHGLVWSAKGSGHSPGHHREHTLPLKSSSNHQELTPPSTHFVLAALIRKEVSEPQDSHH